MHTRTHDKIKERKLLKIQARKSLAEKAKQQHPPEPYLLASRPRRAYERFPQFCVG